MIVSHSRRFIFVHLHKTAGESIRASLEPHVAPGDLVIAPKGGLVQGWLAARRERRIGLEKHSTASEIRERIGGDVFDSYFKFASVRDPIDRMLSLYRWLGTLEWRLNRRRFRRLLVRLPALQHLDETRWLAMRARRETSDFSGFIRHPLLQLDQGARPQADVLCDPSGRLLVDCVIRFESLESDFRLVARRIGIHELPLEWANRSSDPRESEALSAEDIAYLRQRYERDYQLFGFGGRESTPSVDGPRLAGGSPFVATETRG